MSRRSMILAAFASASTTKGSTGAWTHPSTDLGILDPDYYIDLARAVQRGGFDLLFFDDRLAVPTAFTDSPAPAVAAGSRAVKLDLLPILSMVSQQTSTVGLGATYSTTYHAPFHVARAFATLDHLTRGRAVWNIVTSINENEAENFGVEYLSPESRYDRADEFLEIVTQLWDSWQPDAIELDRATGRFADPAKVREIRYEGKWLRSRGPLTLPRPPQGWPVLLQAGQSGRGMTFAARWADLTFTASRDLASAQAHYAEQRQLLTESGRNPQDMRILPAVRVIVGETSEIAMAQADLFDSLAVTEEELVFLSELSNFDFSTVPLDDPLSDELLSSFTGTRGLVGKRYEAARAAFGPGATLRDLVQLQPKSATLRFVGDPSEVADQMCHWFANAACDGFAVIPTDLPGSFERFGRLVVPELRKRGVVDPSATGATVRERLGLPPRTGEQW